MKGRYEMNTEESLRSMPYPLLLQNQLSLGVAHNDRTLMERLLAKHETLEVTIKNATIKLEAVNKAIAQLKAEPEIAATIELLSQVHIL